MWFQRKSPPKPKSIMERIQELRMQYPESAFDFIEEQIGAMREERNTLYDKIDQIMENAKHGKDNNQEN